LSLGFALLAGVWETPIGRYFGLFQHVDDASTEGKNEQKTGEALVKEIDPVQQQLDQVREGTAALEADMKCPGTAGMGDPTERLLQETRQTIQRLERELGGTSP
jgi:hypothetical protein